jgi:hypothetical protein
MGPDRRSAIVCIVFTVFTALATSATTAATHMSVLRSAVPLRAILFSLVGR